MDHSINLQYYQLILMSVVGFLLFVAARVVSTYLDTVIRKKMVEKPLIHGTQEVCGNCLAMQSTLCKVPEIEANQKDLRKNDLPVMRDELKAIKLLTDSLDKRVEKLFRLIEGDWMREISELREALKEKNKEIQRLLNEVKKSNHDP